MRLGDLRISIRRIKKSVQKKFSKWLQQILKINIEIELVWRMKEKDRIENDVVLAYIKRR